MEENKDQQQNYEDRNKEIKHMFFVFLQPLRSLLITKEKSLKFSAAKVWKQDVYASKAFYTNQENIKLPEHSLNWKKIIHQFPSKNHVAKFLTQATIIKMSLLWHNLILKVK